jgi:Zn-dependent peptidase ImmA (M78 family)
MIGQKIRQYRLIKQLSLDELTLKMNGQISKMTISKYERGIINPSEQNLSLIADALDVPVELFLFPSPFNFNLLSFRNKSSLSMRQQDEIKASLTVTTEKILALMDRLDPTYFKSVGRLSKFVVNSFEDVDNAANSIRESWKLGTQPIPNLTEVLESQNILVLFEEHDSEFDGFSAEVSFGDEQIVMGLVFCQKNDPGDRQRFSMAHELGHLLLDIQGELNGEKVANRFASAFLLPRELMVKRLGARRNLITYEELKKFKEDTGVSIQAIIYRMKDLEIISEAHYKEWFQYLTYAGLRNKEEIILKSESSNRIEKLAIRALTEGYIDPQTAIEDYNIEATLADSLVSRNKYFDYQLKEKGGKNMSKKTSGSIAKLASKVLRDGRYSDNAKALAGSALSQAEKKRKA